MSYKKIKVNELGFSSFSFLGVFGKKSAITVKRNDILWAFVSTASAIVLNIIISILIDKYYFN